MPPLNLFYEEPNPDRWIHFDRYPRRVIRRIFRGRGRIGGQQRVFLNLCSGLKRIGQPFRVNDTGYARRHPREGIGIVGKPHLLYERRWQNPILFGASVFSHPLNDPNIFTRVPVKGILVPGEWMRQMWIRYFPPSQVSVWPVGIDTEFWHPEATRKDLDLLLYDKVRWQREKYVPELIDPIHRHLVHHKISFTTIRYGEYEEEAFKQALSRSHGMIFLCEHETQGLAYQQALACDVPILAWDRGGYWQDPEFFPEREKFEPVTSVPYWSQACGEKFQSFEDFEDVVGGFVAACREGVFRPRDYVVNNLTLEHCAHRYLELWDQTFSKVGHGRS